MIFSLDEEADVSKVTREADKISGFSAESAKFWLTIFAKRENYVRLIRDYSKINFAKHSLCLLRWYVPKYEDLENILRKIFPSPLR